jgi:hypothetical protein
MAPSFTPEKAALVGRIRDALRALGYPVPDGFGPATPADLYAMAPAITDFSRVLGAQFAHTIRAAQDHTVRARVFAEAAEHIVRTGKQVRNIENLLGLVVKGFSTYRIAKREGVAAALGAVMETVAAVSR